MDRDEKWMNSLDMIIGIRDSDVYCCKRKRKAPVFAIKCVIYLQV